MSHSTWLIPLGVALLTLLLGVRVQFLLRFAPDAESFRAALHGDLSNLGKIATGLGYRALCFAVGWMLADELGSDEPLTRVDVFEIALLTATILLAVWTLGFVRARDKAARARAAAPPATTEG